MPTLSQDRMAFDFTHNVGEGTLTIDAMPVNPSVADCGMKTSLFFFLNPYDVNADQTDPSRWYEIFSDSSTGKIVQTEQDSAMYLEWPVEQAEYLERLIWSFGYFPEGWEREDPNYVPQAVYIKAKFVTTDLTNGNFIEDEFQITINGQEGGWGSLCSYTGLSLASPSAYDEDTVLYYDITESGGRRDQKILTSLVGRSNLDLDDRCQIIVTLETEVEEDSDEWTPIFSSIEVENNDISSEKLEGSERELYPYIWTTPNGVENMYISMDFNLDFFQSKIQGELYQTEDTLINKAFRIAFRDASQ